jgi:hypothetical protein
MPAIEKQYPGSGLQRPLHALVTGLGVRHAPARPWKTEFPWVLAIRGRRMAKAVSDLIAEHRADQSLIIVTFIAGIGIFISFLILRTCAGEMTAAFGFN